MLTPKDKQRFLGLVIEYGRTKMMEGVLHPDDLLYNYREKAEKQLEDIGENFDSILDIIEVQAENRAHVFQLP